MTINGGGISPLLQPVEGVKKHSSKNSPNEFKVSLGGDKAEIPHKRRSGRHFVSVLKGDFTPSQYKEIPHKKVFGTTLRVGSEGGLLTPSIGCHSEERSDEGVSSFQLRG